MDINGRTVNFKSLEVEGVDIRDFPDFCDAFISYAEFDDGQPLEDHELDQLNDEYPDVVGELAYDACVGMSDF